MTSTIKPGVAWPALEPARSASSATARRPVPPELLVLGYGLPLHALWEFGQTPLYADAGESLGYLVWTRAHCTVGDGLILLGAFAVTSLAMRSRMWLFQCRVNAILAFIGLGLAYTAWSEWFNTAIALSWAYAPAMPTVGGIGVTPLLQWLLVPACVVALTRRFGARLEAVR